MDMSPEFIAAAVAVFVAATVQGATGMGFGLLAAPVLLLLTDRPSSVQTAMILSGLVAVAAVWFVRRNVRFDQALPLLAGIVVGAPVGAWIFLSAGNVMVKIIAATAVGISLYLFLNPMKRSETAKGLTPIDGGLSLASGVMGGALAIPGPAAAALFARHGYSAANQHATLLAFFIPAYAGAAIAQALVGGGLDPLALQDTINLAPVVAAGAITGVLAGKFIPAIWWRRAVIAILITTIAALLYSAATG